MMFQGYLGMFQIPFQIDVYLFVTEFEIVNTLHFNKFIFLLVARINNQCLTSQKLFFCFRGIIFCFVIFSGLVDFVCLVYFAHFVYALPWQVGICQCVYGQCVFIFLGLLDPPLSAMCIHCQPFTCAPGVLLMPSQFTNGVR